MSDKNNLDERISKSVRDLKPYTVPSVKCRIRLDGNESPYNLSDVLAGNLSKSLSAVEINRYPDSSASELRQMISSQTGVPPEGIMLGNGSDELIQIIVECFTGKSGCILVPRPTFSMYRISGNVLGKEVIEVELDDSFDLDTIAIKGMIDKKDPDIFFFATPNNPTANRFSEDRIVDIIDSTSGIVVIDEAYFDYQGDSLLKLIEGNENVIVLRTVSKIGFASLRLGIMLSNEIITRQVNKARLPYNINSISLSVGSVIFENMDLVNEKIEIIKKERERVSEALAGIRGISVYPSDANFLLVDVGDSKKIFDELIKRDILVRRLQGDERLHRCLRVTIGKPEENDELISALSHIFLSQVDIIDKKNRKNK